MSLQFLHTAEVFAIAVENHSLAEKAGFVICDNVGRMESQQLLQPFGTNVQMIGDFLHAGVRVGEHRLGIAGLLAGIFQLGIEGLIHRHRLLGVRLRPIHATDIVALLHAIIARPLGDDQNAVFVSVGKHTADYFSRGEDDALVGVGNEKIFGQSQRQYRGLSRGRQ